MVRGGRGRRRQRRPRAPLACDALPAALLVRFDRPGFPGDTPEARILLVGEVPRDARYARSRARLDASRASAAAAWEAAWATELEAARSDGAVFRPESLDFTPRSVERLFLRPPSGSIVRSVWVEPVPEGRRIILRTGPGGAMSLGADDLDEALRAKASSLGYDVAEDELSMTVPRAGADTFRRLAEDIGALADEREALRRTASRRYVVGDALRERPLAVLRRLAAGFPLAKAPASSSFAYQVNPVSGHSVDADGWAVEALWKAGAIRPAWWSARRDAPRDKPLDAYEASVWVASDLGLDLAAGRIGIREAAERLGEASRAVHVELPEPISFAEAVAFVPDAPWSPPAGAPVPNAVGKANKLPRRAKDLALLSAWLCHGLNGPGRPGMPAGVNQRPAAS